MPLWLVWLCTRICVQLCLLQCRFAGCVPGGPWTYSIDSLASSPASWLDLELNDSQPWPQCSSAGAPGCSPQRDHGPSSVPVSGSVGELWPYHHSGPASWGTALVLGVLGVSACLSGCSHKLLAHPPLWQNSCASFLDSAKLRWP